jgi:hypothetical protein
MRSIQASVYRLQGGLALAFAGWLWIGSWRAALTPRILLSFSFVFGREEEDHDSTME